MGASETRVEVPAGAGREWVAGLAPYAVTIFLSSFLLFQIQPVIARYILPWFGGSPAVWTTCMVFFQTVLILGYAYAHLIGRQPPRTQSMVHLCLLILSLVLLKVEPDRAWRSAGVENPIPVILALLTVCVGAPYLLISSTGPLLQHWFAQTHPGRSPYRLFALSNLGSLLGLVTYPVVVEPLLSLQHQALGWKIGYAVFVVMCGWCAVRFFRAGAAMKGGEAGLGGAGVAGAEVGVTGAVPAWGRRFLWFALAGCASVMLLATTNQVCQNVAVIPFLWILPLSLYLLSFIICFDKAAWYQRVLWVPLAVVSIFGVTGLLYYDSLYDSSLLFQVAVYVAGLFACCMVSHGELARIKPSPRYLTTFYLLIALGGAAGGMFVSLIAPLIFDGFWELHIGLMLTFLLLGFCLRGAGKPDRRKLWRMAWGVGSVVLAGALIKHKQDNHLDPLAGSRNFYGVLRLYLHELIPEDPSEFDGSGFLENNTNAILSMYHGDIVHGTQFMVGNVRRMPTTYYGMDSGIGLAMRFHPRRGTGAGQAEAAGLDRGLKVGVIGLGAGTIAALGRKGDEILFYEINPEVVRLNRAHFTYLPDSDAGTAVHVGDGRILLEEELERDGSHQFDVLALDAFSGDAIPVHLLTLEAFELYMKHLKPDGILAVHISNKFINLGPVLKALSGKVGRSPNLVSNPESEDGSVDEADWVLVTNNPEFLNDSRVNPKIRKKHWEATRSILWTDDYSTLLGLLK